MKRLFETITVAFGMFSSIPVRQVEWTEENRKYSLLAFPLVGAMLGILWSVVALLLAQYLPEASLLTGAALTALPVLVTGGIHLDGYADTYDALSSHGDKDRKLDIMKDPHTGAFAVIHVGIYLVAWFAAAATVQWNLTACLLMLLAFTLSRTLSALAVATFPNAKGSGLAYAFAEDADRGKVRNGCIALLVVLVLCFVSLDIFVGAFPEGCCMCLVAGLVFARYYRVSSKEFGGITGDLAGWFLSKCEVFMLLALAATENF